MPDQTHPARDAHIEALLADPAHAGHPLREALASLYGESQQQLARLERITRISDGFQSMAHAQNQSLTERYHRQLRQLEKVSRISDRYQKMMRELNLALQEASTHDPLTGLANRRLLTERMREEVERAARHGYALVLAILDVDHFKLVNDRYGHDAGDRVLVEISEAMEDGLREYDLCGRWGGEEFVILLPGSQIDDATQVIDRLCERIRHLHVLDAQGNHISVTVSVGLALHQSGESYLSSPG